MPTAHRAETRYSNRIDRHQTHTTLRVLVQTYGAFTMSQDELFPDIDRPVKRVKTPESGLLNFPASYDRTPAHAGQITGPLVLTPETPEQPGTWQESENEQ